MSATTAAPNSSTRNKHSSATTSTPTPPGSYSDPPIDITKEEFSRISDCLKNEEFRKLFLDYCEEIQDPENRKLYESEIIQLEAERGVDVKFVNPEPGFVIKSSVDGALKCFVNVAKSVEVAKPTSEACLNPETGKRGLNWAIPMAQAPPRNDVDAHGKRCRVYDVVFHPDALYLAQRNEAFHKCLIDTALDAVEREYKVKLDRANLKFPKMQFKGVARPTVIRKLAKNAAPETSEPHPLDSIYPAKPGADAGQPKVLPMKTQRQNDAAAKPPEFTAPKYVIKHRRDVDLAEYTNELDAKLSVTVPHELIVEIELPLLNSSAECQLDVTARTLYLLSERPGAKYRLNLNLPYTVDDKRGGARFDTDTRRLCITLPVLAAVEEEHKMRETLLLHLNREDSGVESDMREELNSNSGESPVDDEEEEEEEEDQELSDSLEENTATDQANDEASPTPTPPPLTTVAAPPQTPTKSFLKSSIHYQFPAKFDCNVLDNVMSLVLHVRNVQPESIATQQSPHAKQLHLQFTSIGAGYYPTHYAFCLQLPAESDIRIASFEAEAWENNVVLNLNLATTSENLHRYFAGLDSNDLKAYAVQEKFQVAHNSRQRKKSPPSTSADAVFATVPHASIPPPPFSSTLDISVERSECERSVEIEIKPRGEEQHSAAAAATTTEDERPVCEQATQSQQKKQLNKKQKKHKNKKRRSLSESACDDFNKALQQQQQQQQQQHQQQQQQRQSQQAQQLQQKNSKNKAEHHDDDDDADSSPERAEDAAPLPKSKPKHTASCAVAVPLSCSSPLTSKKQRSYSECRQDSGSCSSSTLPCSFKGILKHGSRYAPPPQHQQQQQQRPSISDSCSSIDEECSVSVSASSSYSCSADAGMAASSLLHRFASHSFSDIPEEHADAAGLSESCKKTVRFNEVIMKQVFRLDSSILGQRKKNQKRRDRKQRALQRRLSEGDSADYEDNKPVALPATAAQYFKSKDSNQNCNHSKAAKKPIQHDSGLDLSSSAGNGKTSKPKGGRARFESESSSDVDGTKNSMMFEMDM